MAPNFLKMGFPNNMPYAWINRDAVKLITKDESTYEEAAANDRHKIIKLYIGTCSVPLE